MRNFCAQQGGPEGAEPILVDALRIDPGNISILEELGELYVVTEDWPGAEQVRATLGRVGSLPAETMANDLQAQILQGQQKIPEAIEFLEELADQDNSRVQAWVALFRIHTSSGEPEEANDIIKEVGQAIPDDPTLMWIDAGLLEPAGELEAAIAIYE